MKKELRGGSRVGAGRPPLKRNGPIINTTITEEVSILAQVRTNHGSLVNGVRFAAKNKPKK